METKQLFDFPAYTGKGVKVAVIDSGVDTSHPEIHHISGGVGIMKNPAAGIEITADYQDRAGHGTACAGIIKQKAPAVELYSVKIFPDADLTTEPEVLAAAIRWAADQGIQVANLSVGITTDYEADSLQTACDYAESKNCILVAADTNGLDDAYPAFFSNVIGVTGGKIKDPDQYYYLGNNPIEFAAKGDLQRIPWLDGKNAFLERNSFAAPHLTGLIAKILEKYPGSTLAQVKEILKDNAQTGEVELIIPLKQTVFFLKQRFQAGVAPAHSKFAWIKSACLFPYNKEMHAFIRARDLLSFPIRAVADVMGKGLVGKDAGAAIGIENINLKIEHDLEQALAKADTLILGHLGELERLRKNEILMETLQKAIRFGKNVYHLDPPPETPGYRELQAMARNQGVTIASQFIEEVEEEYLRAASRIKIRVPVVGVFGTSAQQGKFTAQLALRRILLENDYQVAQIGTEPHSELFGMDFGFPIGHQALVKWPERFYISYLHYKMLEITEQKDPDIFIVGAQSNLIPYDIQELETINLGAIAFLLGTQPDAYILAINSMDSEEYIWRTLRGMESLGEGKTIGMILSDKEKRVKTVFGRSSLQSEQLSQTELYQKMKQIESVFGIPVVEVVSPEGRQALLDIVLRFFAAPTKP